MSVEIYRQTVNRYLEMMREGDAPAHFKAVAEIFVDLQRKTKLPRVTVLNAGCGLAQYFEILQNYVPGWCQYVGIDRNPEMLRIARGHYPGAVLGRMDAREIFFEDRSFDFVLAGSAVRESDWEKVLRELCRVSRKWLVLHGATVLKEGPTVIAASESDSAVLEVRLNEQQLLGLLKACGFRCVKALEAGEGSCPPGQENNTYLFERA